MINGVKTARTRGLQNNECYTPKWVFDALDITFDLDVCAPAQPTNVPCHNRYTIQDNGLIQPWFGNVWMNPPYSKPLPWVQKFIQHNNGIALLPTTSGKWMLELWQAQTTWVPLPPIRFDKSDGTQHQTTFPNRCWLVAAGNHNAQALTRIGHVR